MSEAGVCRMELVPGGPGLLRGVDVVETEDGQRHPVTRPVVAVCLCGLSQRQPWCDGTHKAARLAELAKARAERDPA